MATNTTTSDNSDDRRQSTAKNHHETTAESVMGELKFEPDAARFQIGKLHGHSLVDISINNDALSMRSILEPDQAERIGERLLSMAEAAREDADG
ncbi:hypothetical protein NDI54_20960 [Haloarcula sp. S1AR25-5A]|uniref:Uncharacterized protein n=1 Tax=Haloarcula terrestris TaxID=2950533 RepID=A0AAE4F2Q2_9EURY|nr:hypothetical protein [Haloarcula terrestris]MDS0223802.1 hypothetical protein [Haloarcula terrestris]